MTKPATTYQPLGNFIQIVDRRNRDLQVTKLLGLSIEKCFIPSIANTIGTDMSTYKIIQPRQFAYGPVTSRNGDKITIALYTGDEPAIISQAYVVFEITGTYDTVETQNFASLQQKREQLLPEYLMMWFRRPEFDRYARYHSHGSAREIFDWDEMCATQIPVPPIAEQRAIVAEYAAVQHRMEVNKRLIAKLEETAQTLYKKMFVEGVDKENLPDGWRMGTLGEVCEITMGQSPDGETYNEMGNGMIFYQGRTDFGNRFPSIRMFTTDPKRFAKKGDILLSVRAPVGDINIAPHDCCIGRGLASIRERNNCQSYAFYLLQSLSDVFTISDDEGTIFGSITKDDLNNIEIIAPTKEKIRIFDNEIKAIDKSIELHEQEITKLIELQSLLLARMGK